MTHHFAGQTMTNNIWILSMILNDDSQLLILFYTGGKLILKLPNIQRCINYQAFWFKMILFFITWLKPNVNYLQPSLEHGKFGLFAYDIIHYLRGDRPIMELLPRKNLAQRKSAGKKMPLSVGPHNRIRVI